MAQIWIIKDTAPVDTASQTLSKQECSFTSNGKSFNSIEILDNGAGLYTLAYNGTEYAGVDIGTDSYFSWENNAYKRLIFNTAPTGALLTWLQKNADQQIETEYLTTDIDLIAVADAIRAKTNQTGAIMFPAGYVEEINNLSTSSTENPVEVQVLFSVANDVDAHWALVYQGTNGMAIEILNVDDVNGSTVSIIPNTIFYIAQNQNIARSDYHYSGSWLADVDNSISIKYYGYLSTDITESNGYVHFWGANAEGNFYDAVFSLPSDLAGKTMNLTLHYGL